MSFPNIFLSVFFSLNILFIQETCYSQNSESIAKANQNFKWGIMAFNNKNYLQAIDYFLISIANYPQSITYYSLTNAYAYNGNEQQSLVYADIALRSTPALEAKYISSLEKIKIWAYQVQEVRSKVTGGALTVLPVVPPTVVGSESSLITIPGNADNSTIEKIIIFPGGGIKTSGEAELGQLQNNSNITIGYIKYYGFSGARDLHNGNSIASTFSVGVSNSDNPRDYSSFVWIVYKINELYPGSVKYQQVGNITYKTIILSVQKYQSDSYIMGSVKTQVTAVYPMN